MRVKPTLPDLTKKGDECTIEGSTQNIQLLRDCVAAIGTVPQDVQTYMLTEFLFKIRMYSSAINK